MSSIVTVVFDHHREYELIVHRTISREAANQWMDEQWEALDCQPSNPMGKVLALDKILGVAKYAGEKRFADHGAWAEAYAQAVAALLQRPAVRVDVGAHVVG